MKTRAAFAFADWMSTLRALADAESRMLAVLGELGLTGLVTTIPGLSGGERGGDLRIKRPWLAWGDSRSDSNAACHEAYPARCGYHR